MNVSTTRLTTVAQPGKVQRMFMFTQTLKNRIGLTRNRIFLLATPMRTRRLDAIRRRADSGRTY